MKVINLFLILSFSLFLVGCKQEPKSPIEVAEHYYNYLVKGDVDHYLKGMADYDSLPEDYRLQLHDMHLQFLDNEQRLRGGLASAHALRDTVLDESRAYVFMELQYGDSTCEQVSLPLVLTPQGWRLR